MIPREARGLNRVRFDRPPRQGRDRSEAHGMPGEKVIELGVQGEREEELWTELGVLLARSSHINA
eukprot:8224903-Pyramimonas_sp.AAC.1